MIDEQIISNLGLEPTETAIDVWAPLSAKIYEIPGISKGKVKVYLMEYNTDGQPVATDTNVVYSARGYFHVSNKILKDKNTRAVYNLIAKKLDIKLKELNNLCCN
jgi:hypothetical protein